MTTQHYLRSFIDVGGVYYLSNYGSEFLPAQSQEAPVDAWSEHRCYAPAEIGRIPIDPPSSQWWMERIPGHDNLWRRVASGAGAHAVTMTAGASGATQAASLFGSFATQTSSLQALYILFADASSSIGLETTYADTLSVKGCSAGGIKLIELILAHSGNGGILPDDKQRAAKSDSSLVLRSIYGLLRNHPSGERVIFPFAQVNAGSASFKEGGLFPLSLTTGVSRGKVDAVSFEYDGGSAQGASIASIHKIQYAALVITGRTAIAHECQPLHHGAAKLEGHAAQKFTRKQLTINVQSGVKVVNRPTVGAGDINEGTKCDATVAVVA